MLNRREKGQRDRMTGCHHVSSCTNIYEPEQLTELLDYNFEHHYNTNRAPLSLAFNPAWLLSKSKGTEGSSRWNDVFVDALDQWMTKVLKEHRDVYFLTNLQVIQWMQNPTRVSDLNTFGEWKVGCQKGPRDWNPLLGLFIPKLLPPDKSRAARAGADPPDVHGLPQDLPLAT
jgi:hypothetical protein